MTNKKMNSNLPIKEIATQTSQVSWSERIGQDPIFHWILSYGRYLIIAIVTLIAILLLFYRTSEHYSATAETDFAIAAQNFAHFQREVTQGANREVIEGKGFKELQHILNRRPELHSKYDGALAQLLLLIGANDLAEEYAQLALARTSLDALP